METGGSTKRTNCNESPFAVVPKRQRVVLEEIPDVPPGFQPIHNPNLTTSPSTISLLPISSLDEPYVSDISEYLRMMEIEEKRKPKIDYIEKVQRWMTPPNMRGKLVDWLVKVADVFKLLPETLHLAISYIDRFLSIKFVDRSKLQLLGISAMLIASKYEEVNPPKAVDFCQFTSYELHELLEMEVHILKSLNYEMGNPNVITFLRMFAVIASENQTFIYLCNYLADLSLLEYECLEFKPSHVAAAVIFLAKFIIQPRVHPWPSHVAAAVIFLAKFIIQPIVHPWTLSLNELCYGPDDLEDCVTILHDLYLSRRVTSLRVIRNKYKQNKFKCVANLPSPPELPERYFEEVRG